MSSMMSSVFQSSAHTDGPVSPSTVPLRRSRINAVILRHCRCRIRSVRTASSSVVCRASMCLASKRLPCMRSATICSRALKGNTPGRWRAPAEAGLTRRPPATRSGGLFGGHARRRHVTDRLVAVQRIRRPVNATSRPPRHFRASTPGNDLLGIDADVLGLHGHRQHIRIAESDRPATKRCTVPTTACHAVPALVPHPGGACPTARWPGLCAPPHRGCATRARGSRRIQPG